jgi:hypothetical protein
MATSCGLLELVGLGRLLGLLELVGLGRLLGLLDLVGLLELGGLPLVGFVARLVGTMTLMVGWGPGVCLRAGGLVLPGVVDEEADTLGDGWPAEEVGDWLGM